MVDESYSNSEIEVVALDENETSIQNDSVDAVIDSTSILGDSESITEDELIGIDVIIPGNSEYEKIDFDKDENVSIILGEEDEIDLDGTNVTIIPGDLDEEIDLDGTNVTTDSSNISKEQIEKHEENRKNTTPEKRANRALNSNLISSKERKSDTKEFRKKMKERLPGIPEDVELSHTDRKHIHPKNLKYFKNQISKTNKTSRISRVGENADGASVIGGLTDGTTVIGRNADSTSIIGGDTGSTSTNTEYEFIAPESKSFFSKLAKIPKKLKSKTNDNRLAAENKNQKKGQKKGRNQKR